MRTSTITTSGARLLCGLATLILTAAFASPTAFGQSVSDSELKRSIWSSKYEALNGQTVSTRLSFNGSSGSYAGGRGQLSNVKYQLTVGGGATITGNWSMGGTNGTFTFFVAGNSNPLIFSGAWKSQGRSGNWNGQFQGLGQEPAILTGGGGGGATTALATVTYGDWNFNQPKGYYYRVCSFPAGAYQYVIYYPSKPNWVYWYNPAKSVFWCACPTANHPKWGGKITAGEDLFLMADTKSGDIATTVFPDAGDDGANFVSGTATDKDGSTVDLGCPPTDLP
jgi:hypothetical protein